jgi:LuxR family maltose regulon positive regulatory protein
LAAAHWTRLTFRQDTYRQMFDTVGIAPEEVLRQHPRASLMAEIMGRLPGGSTVVSVPAGEARIDQVLSDGTARDLVELAILGMIARRAAHQPVEAFDIARASRPLLRAAATTRFSAAADLAAYWHLQAGQAALHCADLGQAALDFHQAWTFRDSDVTGYVATSTAPFLALLSALTGDTAGATRWGDEVERLATQGRSLIEWDTMERPRLVARLLDTSDRLDVAAGREIAGTLYPQLAFDEIWPVTLLALVRHLVVADEPGRAEQLVATTTDLHPGAPESGTMHAAFVALARAEVALALGRSSSVRRLVGGPDAALLPGQAAVCLTRLEVAAGDLASARRLAAVAEHQPDDERARRECRVLRVAIDDDQGAAGLTPYPPVLRRTAALLPRDLNERLRATYGADVPPPLASLVGANAPAVKLTPSEERVLDALRGPGGLPQVAERLFISRNTLKSHLRALYAKLGVASREEAVAVAGRLGLLEHDEGPPP